MALLRLDYIGFVLEIRGFGNFGICFLLEVEVWESANFVIWEFGTMAILGSFEYVNFGILEFDFKNS